MQKILQEIENETYHKTSNSGEGENENSLPNPNLQSEKVNYNFFEPELNNHPDSYDTRLVWEEDKKIKIKPYVISKKIDEPDKEKELQKTKKEILLEQFTSSLICKNYIIKNEQLKMISNLIKKQIKRKNDVDTGQDYKILITGQTGSGKSWLAIILAMLLDPNFNLFKNIAYYSNSEQVLQKFDSLDRYQNLVIDEAIMSMDKMSFASKDFRQIVQKLNTDRYKNIITTFLIPSINNLAKDIRDNEIHMWINIIECGTATVHFKPSFAGNAASFSDLWEDVEKMVKRKKFINLQMYEILKVFEKHATYLCTLENIPAPFEYPEIAKEYNRLKELSREIATVDNETKYETKERYTKTPVKSLINGYLKLILEGKSLTEIGDLFNITGDTISIRIKSVHPEFNMNRKDGKGYVKKLLEMT